MKTIAIDTETARDRSFMITTCDEQLRKRLYEEGQHGWFAAVKRICEDPKWVKVFHNAPYDMYVLSNQGVRVVGPIEDTMDMANLMEENYSPKNLKALAKVHLNETTNEAIELRPHISRLKRLSTAELHDLVKNFERRKGENDPLRKFEWDNLPREIIRRYAKQDPYYTLCLYYLWKNPIKEFQKTYDLEKRLAPIVVEMTKKGIAIDRRFVAEQIVTYRDRANRAFRQMRTLLRQKGLNPDTMAKGKGFNPGSPKQLLEVFKVFGIEPTKKTKKGEGVSTDTEVLQEFAHHKIVELIIRYRFYTGQVTKYYAKLYFKYTSRQSNVAHFTFYKVGAKSGRFSAELVQTIPRVEDVQHTGQAFAVRRAFYVRPGRVLVFIDYSQIEMRLFGHYARAKLIIRDIKRGFDPYLGMAYILFSKKLVEESEKLKKACRRVSKTISLGIIYGMGKKKLITSLTIEFGKRVLPEIMERLGLDTRRAVEILNTYYEKYPVREYIRGLIRQLYMQGAVRLKIESPRMHVDRLYRVPPQLAYKSANIIIQGTAAYVLKHAMVRCSDRIKKMDYPADMLLTVHDELIFEIDDVPEWPEIALDLKQQMEDRITFRVPITCDMKYSYTNWAEAKEWTSLHYSNA